MNIKNLVIILLLASQTCPLFCMTKIQQKPSAYTSSTIHITPRMLLLGAGIGAVSYFLYKKHQAKKHFILEKAKKNLFFACSQLEGLPMVEESLNFGVDVNLQDEDGQTSLIIATLFRRYEIVKALLERGADCMIQDSQNKTAWDYAKLSDEEEILRLIEKNATEKFFYEHYDSIKNRFSVSDETIQKYVDAGINLDEKHFSLINGPDSLRPILKCWGAIDMLKQVDAACAERDSRTCNYRK